MQDEMSTGDLTERLALIESMIAEGRRTVERWGWTFLLWGVAFSVAIVWATRGQSLSVWGRSDLAWPVTMLAAFALTLGIGFVKGKGQPGTAVGRAILSLWTCVGISMLLLFPALSIAGRLDEHVFVALVAVMLGLANGASGIILKWRMQFVAAVIWWATAVAACFCSGVHVTELFLTAIFLCQILFGLYAMGLEWRRRLPGEVHV